MKKILTSILVLALSQAMLANNPKVKNQDVSPQQLQKQNKEITKLVVAQLSKGLPKDIDKYTQFVNIEAIGATLVYTFEINTGAKNDKAVRLEDRTRMKEAVTSGICRSSKRFMDAKITITYLYRSAKSKAKLFQFDIKQENCFNLYNGKL